MGEKLPFLALRAFAAIGASGSLRKAADDLGVTVGAVSQHLKILEAYLGTQLMLRGGRYSALTSAGRKLLDEISDPFRQLEQACDNIRPRRSRTTLSISVLGSFAVTWLSPRLASFISANPDINIRIETTGRLVDLHNEPIDLALRYGGGDYENVRSVMFLRPSLVAVASPSTLLGVNRMSARDFLEFPLLQDNLRQDWAFWFRSHGIVDARTSRGPTFEDDLVLIQAAAAGQGLALIRDIYGRVERNAGTLVQLLGPVLPPRAYHLVCRPALFRQRKVKLFSDWLIGEGDFQYQ